jgi:hypothetical protein
MPEIKYQIEYRAIHLFTGYLHGNILEAFTKAHVNYNITRTNELV